jgi:hypothetical protein
MCHCGVPLGDQFNHLPLARGDRSGVWEYLHVGKDPAARAVGVVHVCEVVGPFMGAPDPAGVLFPDPVGYIRERVEERPVRGVVMIVGDRVEVERDVGAADLRLVTEVTFWAMMDT